MKVLFIIFGIVLVAAIAVVAGCRIMASRSTEATVALTAKLPGKVAVVYYSQSKVGNTVTVAKWPEPNGKPYYLVATMAENMDWDLVKAPLQGFVDCFEGAKIKGFLKAGGVYEPGAVKKTKFMKAAFDLGRRI